MGQSLLFVIFAPLARQLGIEEWQLGFIIAASNMALAVSAPRWGRASETLGRRTVFLIGLGGYAVGYAALALGVQAVHANHDYEPAAQDRDAVGARDLVEPPRACGCPAAHWVAVSPPSSVRI